MTLYKTVSWEQTVAILRSENARLRAALEPFAGIAAWADRCAEQDRSLGLRDFMLYLESHAFGSGYKISADDIRKARKALASEQLAK